MFHKDILVFLVTLFYIYFFIEVHSYWYVKWYHGYHLIVMHMYFEYIRNSILIYFASWKAGSFWSIILIPLLIRLELFTCVRFGISFVNKGNAFNAKRSFIEIFTLVVLAIKMCVEFDISNKHVCCTT